MRLKYGSYESVLTIHRFYFSLFIIFFVGNAEQKMNFCCFLPSESCRFSTHCKS